MKNLTIKDKWNREKLYQVHKLEEKISEQHHSKIILKVEYK